MAKEDVNWSQVYQMKFGLSIMEYLDTLKEEILAQLRDKGNVDDQQKQELSQAIMLMNTAGDPISNDILRIMSDRLQDALEPQYPFNFVDPLLVDKRFAMYKKALKRAMAKHTQVWEQLYQNLSKMMLSQRPEDTKKDLFLLDKFKEWYKKK